MLDPMVEKEILDQLNRLDHSKQQQVLAFAQSLARSARRGTPGTVYRGLAGGIAADDLERMTAAIEAGCEQVHLDEW